MQPGTVPPRRDRNRGDEPTLIRDLAEEVRAIKRRKLRPSSFASLEYALDKVILPELGQLTADEAGADRISEPWR